MTQNEKVLQYLKINGSITSMDAFNKLRITRLSARIYDLRKMGHTIGSVYRRVEDGHGNFLYGYDTYYLKGQRDE